MYEDLTPRWAIFIFGCFAALLALVPFVAFFKGPAIRARSKYSKELMREERERIEREQGERVGLKGIEGGIGRDRAEDGKVESPMGKNG